MKIGILGAGITGLSAGRLLSQNFDIEIIESLGAPGGIARTKTVEGMSYHTTGGHCLNSKYPEVLELIFNEIMPKHEWHKVTRKAVIQFKGQQVNYPIEYAIKQIFAIDKNLALKIVKEFLASNDDNADDNLDSWFRKKFGTTLAEEYFIPYNKKIWNTDPADMDPAWVEDKLPIPNIDSFISSLIDSAEDSMPHTEFYYPNSNNQNTFVENLAKGLNIRYSTRVDSISYEESEKCWVVNNSFKYDKIISTLPLNVLPGLLKDCPLRVVKAASNLKYNKVSTMIWESMPTESTWTYIPNPTSIFHRYIHIGNFFRPRSNYTITESIGERSYAEMHDQGKKDPFLIRSIDNHISEHAYVIFDKNYHSNKKVIFDYLNAIELDSIGRFGEWEYYNMDVCIKRAMELNKKILRQRN